MSSHFSDLLGGKLLSSSGDIPTADALIGKSAVALYFSAHWCPPCRGFTPKFAEWYKEHLKEKGLEVVFVSSDRDEDSFKEYFGEMPWLALPYGERQLKETLSKKYKVQGIPAVVILDGDGGVISKDGRGAISKDPTGEEFPWKPKSLKEILSGAKFIGKEGAVDAGTLDGNVFGLYFSAHWCPPCRGFTPKLAEWYTKDLKNKGFEIVFVSSDRDEGAFNDYYKEQPWLALDYSNRKEKEQLSDLFGVQGIPSFVIIDKDGSTITKDGRSAVSNDPEGAEFPWYPKPVKNLSEGPGLLNEAATVIAFCETDSPAAQKAAEESMVPLAKKYIDAAKAAGDEDPKISFMIATTTSGISTQLRSMLSLPQLPPAVHEHPLEEADRNGGQWGCDGCNKGGNPDTKRFRCTKGCDFDYCEECNSKSDTKVELPSKLMLLNIPDDGAFHDGPEGEITANAVEQLVSSFEAGSLERKQLSK